MIEYALKYPEKLYGALGQHLMLVAVTLVLSLILAAALTVCAMYFKTVSNGLIHLFSVIYSIPSLAMFAMLIPVTGLGTKTALIVLTLYNQYLLLRNFTAGLNGVDSSVIEAAAGMGMTTMQILLKTCLWQSGPSLPESALPSSRRQVSPQSRPPSTPAVWAQFFLTACGR